MKNNRQLGRAIKKLQKSKSAAESLRIMAELKARDPKTYEALKNR